MLPRSKPHHCFHSAGVFFTALKRLQIFANLLASLSPFSLLLYWFSEQLIQIHSAYKCWAVQVTPDGGRPETPNDYLQPTVSFVRLWVLKCFLCCISLLSWDLACISLIRRRHAFICAKCWFQPPVLYSENWSHGCLSTSCPDSGGRDKCLAFGKLVWKDGIGGGGRNGLKMKWQLRVSSLAFWLKRLKLSYVLLVMCGRTVRGKKNYCDCVHDV